MVWVIRASSLGLGFLHCAHNIALMQPHFLQLLGRVFLKCCHDIFNKGGYIKALWAIHYGAAALAHCHTQCTKECQVANIEVFIVSRH